MARKDAVEALANLAHGQACYAETNGVDQSFAYFRREADEDLTEILTSLAQDGPVIVEVDGSVRPA